ncbi:MAG: glycosyltransferase [Gorillibacterium sp.]|nr:glycosyltransferase [Gorillibacterium sp.]
MDGMNILNSVEENAMTDGFTQGFSHGYYLGRAQAAARPFEGRILPLWDRRVVFIQSGKGFPYAPLDHAVFDAISSLTTQFVAADPGSNVVDFATEWGADLVLVMEGMDFSQQNADLLRSRGIKTAIWFMDDPYYTDVTRLFAPHYDYVFTIELNCVEFYKSLGCVNTFYLPLGVDTKLFRYSHVSPNYRSDICFIGSAYWNRVHLFDSIAAELHQRNTRITGLWWDRLENFNLLAPKIRLNEWLPPEETAQYYSGAAAVINLHRAHDDETYNQNSLNIPAFSVNPRMFEISACGVLQLTDERADLSRFYEPGSEIIVYSSPADLAEKLNYYLAHPEERIEIGMRALKRTLRDHTFVNRVTSLFSTIFNGS